MPRSRPHLLTLAADGVGVVSLTLGGLLVTAPRRAGEALGLTASTVSRRRTLGTADTLLGSAILASRASPRRWSAVAARAVLHLLFAQEYVRAGRRTLALAMDALFVTDAGIALGLRGAGPGRGRRRAA